MSDPLKRHSERVNYIAHYFMVAARSATSVQQLETGRSYIWGDLQQIGDPVVRRGAQEIFRTTMCIAESLERRTPEAVGQAITSGLKTLIEYLEANDV